MTNREFFQEKSPVSIAPGGSLALSGSLVKPVPASVTGVYAYQPERAHMGWFVQPLCYPGPSGSNAACYPSYPLVAVQY